MGRTAWKRGLAAMLASVMIFTSVDITGAASLDKEITMMTDGQAIAEYYEEYLTDAETAVLECTALSGEQYEIVAPGADNEDGLVAVDSTLKMIDAESKGNWIPVSAEVVFADGSEAVVLTDGEGTFAHDGDDYKVKVTYQFQKTIQNQNVLINTPHYLAEGVCDLEYLFRSSLKTVVSLEGEIPTLLDIAEGVTLPDGTFLQYTGGTAYTGIEDLKKMSEEYKLTSSKVSYLLTQGGSVQQAAAATYNYAKTVANSEELVSVIFALSKSDDAACRSLGKDLGDAVAKCAKVENLLADIVSPAWDAPYVNSLTPLLKSDVTEEELKKLDKKVLSAVGKTSVHTVDDEQTVVAEEATVTSIVKCLGVNVVLKARVIGDDNIPKWLDEHKVRLMLPYGATKSDVLAAIDAYGIEEEALASWNEGTIYEVNAENYVRTTTQLAEELEKDMQYTIIYRPKGLVLDMDFADMHDSIKVPYGYTYTLPASGDMGTTYDYQIEGEEGTEELAQAQVLRATEDVVILQSESPTTIYKSVTQLVAEDYADVLTDKEESILGASALKGDRYEILIPSSDSVQVIISGETITGTTFASGVSGWEWVPAVGHIIGGSMHGTTFAFDGLSATLPAVDYERVEVDYRLTIRSVDADKASYYLNLPATLVAEANQQKSDMDLLASQQSNINSISVSTLKMVGMFLEAYDAWPSTMNALETIQKECMDSDTGKPYLLKHVAGYKSSGLAYYYKDDNYKVIKQQVKLLSQQLNIIAGDPNDPSTIDPALGKLKGFMPSAGDKIDKLGTIARFLEGIAAGFAPPNDAINVDSPDLAALIAILNGKGSVTGGYTPDGVPLKLERTFTAVNANEVELAVIVEVLDGKGAVAATLSTSETYDKGKVIDDLNIILNMMYGLESELTSYDLDHYTNTVINMPEVGHVMDRNLTVKFTWTPEVYTVKIDGEEDQRFSYADEAYIITLPACPEIGFAYDYLIGDKVIQVEDEPVPYAFDSLAYFNEERVYTITRERINVGRERLIHFAKVLNEALAMNGDSGDVAFIPVESADGTISLVLRLTATSDLGSIADAMVPVATAMVTDGGYSYIGMGDKAFVHNGEISAQSLVDMMMADSGFGTETILELVDSTGQINEVSIDGTVITECVGTVREPNLYGGKLLKTKLNLGNSPNKLTASVPTYITVEDFDGMTATLLKARNSIEDMSPYLVAKTQNGVMNLDLTFPEDIYAVYVLHMLAMEHVDLKNISDVYLKEVLDDDYNMLKPVLEDTSVTTNTFENTLNKIGLNKDLSGYSSALNSVLSIVRNLMDNMTLKESGEQVSGTYTCDANYSLTKIIEEQNLGIAAELIKEKDSGVIMPLDITLSNVSEHYEALVLDSTKSGLDKIMLAKDAAAAVSSAGADSMVILLNNVNGNLHFNKSATLDLNGKTVQGNLGSADMVVVMDSSLSTSGSGCVTGYLTGEFQVTDGVYVQDVSALLPEDYVQVDGTVRNRAYTIQKDESGNYVVLLNADFLKMSFDESKGLTASLALDIARNSYSWASLNINGIQIQTSDLHKVLDIYSKGGSNNVAAEAVKMIDKSGLGQFSTMMLRDMTNFRAMRDSVEAGQPFATYTVTTSAWDMSADVVGNYIDLDVIPDDSSRTRSLSLMFVGSEEEKADFMDLADALDKSVIIEDLSVDVKNVAYTKNGVEIQSATNADIIIDYADDEYYTVAIGVIAANGNPACKKELIDAMQNNDIEGIVNCLETITTTEFVEAMKAAEGSSFDDLVDKLNLDNYAQDIKDFKDKYYDVLKISYSLIEKHGASGSEQTLASLKTGKGTYRIEKGDMDNMNLTLTVKLATEVSNYPDIEFGRATLNNVVLGYDYKDNVIYLDVDAEGLSEAEFKQYVRFDAVNAARYNVEFVSGLTENGLVANGAVIKVSTSNMADSVEKMFRVIIVGDVWADGVMSNTDAVWIAGNYLYGDTEYPLSEDQIIAADVYQDGVLSNTDCVRIVMKFLEYGYESTLKVH